MNIMVQMEEIEVKEKGDGDREEKSVTRRCSVRAVLIGARRPLVSSSLSRVVGSVYTWKGIGSDVSLERLLRAVLSGARRPRCHCWYSEWAILMVCCCDA